MRRSIVGLAVVLGFATLAPTVRAQVPGTGFSDPFFLYYGFYLPRQAALAAQPSTPAMVNDVAAQRQTYALADRQGLYDPVSPLGMDQYDPNNPFGRTRGPAPLPRLPQHFVSPRPSNGVNLNQAYNRTARYHPTVRSGSNANRNVVGGSRYARTGSGMAVGAAAGGFGYPG
jgi:hypothetical protein